MDTTSLLVKEERIKPHDIGLKQHRWSKAGAKIQSSGQEAAGCSDPIFNLMASHTMPIMRLCRKVHKPKHVLFCSV